MNLNNIVEETSLRSPDMSETSNIDQIFASDSSDTSDITDNFNLNIELDVHTTSTNIEKDEELFQKNKTTINNSQKSLDQSFKRKFKNVDMATCWLNSCLQLLLTAIDDCVAQPVCTSELGRELIKLKLNDEDESLEPTIVKHIVVTAEDTRIALRLSELA